MLEIQLDPFFLNAPSWHTFRLCETREKQELFSTIFKNLLRIYEVVQISMEHPVTAAFSVLSKTTQRMQRPPLLGPANHLRYECLPKPNETFCT